MEVVEIFKSDLQTEHKKITQEMLDRVLGLLASSTAQVASYGVDNENNQETLRLRINDKVLVSIIVSTKK